MPVLTGLDRIAVDPRTVAGRRVVLLSHAAALDARLRSSRRVLAEAGARIDLVLAPEHGWDGVAQDMEPVGDERGGVPVRSVYGSRVEDLSPDPAWLRGADLVVVDLVDVGARYYTFVWSALLTLEVAARVGLRTLVLDRPNPLGGLRVEGAPNRPGFTSFVGLEPVAVRHGLTIGELLRLAAARRGLGDALDVLPMEGWRREMTFEDTGLSWAHPSPNMPTPATAAVYPGACLVEGTNASEGRGTTRPFEIAGAPWIDGEALARRLDAERLPGVAFRAVRFRPAFQKHAGRACGGVAIHVTDRGTFLPYRTGLALVAAMRSVGGGAFAWRTEPYEFVAHPPAIDLLTGGSEFREGLDAGVPVVEIVEAHREQERAFEEERRAFLIY